MLPENKNLQPGQRLKAVLIGGQKFKVKPQPDYRNPYGSIKTLATNTVQSKVRNLASQSKPLV